MIYDFVILIIVVHMNEDFHVLLDFSSTWKSCIGFDGLLIDMIWSMFTNLWDPFLENLTVLNKMSVENYKLF